MMKINMLGDKAIKALNLKIAIDKALQALRDRSYSGRHPELGKMIKCPICRLRHRETRIIAGVVTPCVERYYKDSNGEDFVALGIKPPKSRKHEHSSTLRLQLVERTQKLFWENVPYFTDMKACMQESREMAIRELKVERRRDRRNERRASDVSRRINAGLAVPGSRAQVLTAVKIKPATYQARKAKNRAAQKANEQARIANESI